MTNLADLKGMGGVLSAVPVQRTIKFKIDGNDFDATVYVKRLTVGEQEKLADRSADDAKSRRAVMISELVRLGEDGSEEITYLDAYQLHPSIGKAMIAAISEVNGIDGKKA